MKRYRLLSDIASDADIEAAFEWYESEQSELGLEFLDEVRGAYTGILEGPFKYQELRSGIRRAIKLEPQVSASLPELLAPLTQAREKILVSLSAETQRLLLQPGREIFTTPDQTFDEQVELAQKVLDVDERDSGD